MAYDEQAGKDTYEPPEEEKQAVTRWQERVERAEKRDPYFERDIELWRRYVYGIAHRDQTGKALTRTNMIFATMAGMLPHLYAKNPEIAVTPAKGTPKERLPVVKKFCQTSEQVLAELLIDEAKLKRRVKANLRATMSTSYGVLKLLLQEELRGDPLAIRRVQDAQDNLNRIEGLTRKLKNEDDPNEKNAEREALKSNIAGMMAGNEIKMFKGFVLDRVRSEDFLILDESIAEFDEYVEASALAHRVWMTCNTYYETFKHYPEKATKYNSPYKPEDAGTGQTKAPPPGEMYICVLEIWDKEAQVIRTVAKGSSRWCREPYPPKHTSQRWYPFFIVGFNLVEGRWRPISDTELLMGLQDEYNTTRTNFADAREKAVPKRVFRKAGGLTENDIKNLTDAMNKDWVGVEGSPTIPIKDDVMQLDGPRIDPLAYDVTLIRNDMDLMVGMSDAGRANLIKPKTATEAELMAQALMSRSEERRDANEDMMSEMSEAALEIALRAFTKAEVQQMAGPEAEWPEGESVEEIFSMVNVGVRAGSSGRPNSQKEKEQWTQILPVIKETMQAVAELRAAGNFDMANAAIELLRETVRRFEERIDVDSFIPPVEMGEDGKPVQQAQQMQQAAHMGEQLKLLQEQLQELQAELLKAKQQDQAKAAEMQAKGALAVEQERNRAAEIAAEERASNYEADKRTEAEMYKADQQRSAAESQGDSQAGVEREKLDSDERRHGTEKKAAIEVERIKQGLPGSEEELAEAKAEREAQAAERAAADQRMQAVLQSVSQSVVALEHAIAEMAAAAKAPRRSDVILGENGLPKALVSKQISKDLH